MPRLRQIVHLDLDGFLIAVERAADPSLRDRPLVVGGHAGATGTVAAASAEALAQGVRPGCSLREAAERCPEAAFLEGSFDRYLDAAAALDDVVRRRCPRVEWTSLDEAYLDLTDPLRPAAHARRLAEDLQEDIRSAFRFDIAMGLATGKVVAHVASRLTRPRGLLTVLPGYEARFLAPLGLALLPTLDAAARARLQQAGVATIGELAALPPDRAAAWLGREAATLLRHAIGRDETPVVASEVPRAIRATAAVSSPECSEADPLTALTAATAQVTGQLSRQRALARGITVSVRHRGGLTSPPRSASLPSASADQETILCTARKLFVRGLRPRAVPLSVTVSLSGLVAAVPQLSLFGPHTRPVRSVTDPVTGTTPARHRAQRRRWST